MEPNEITLSRYDFRMILTFLLDDSSLIWETHSSSIYLSLFFCFFFSLFSCPIFCFPLIFPWLIISCLIFGICPSIISFCTRCYLSSFMWTWAYVYLWMWMWCHCWCNRFNIRRCQYEYWVLCFRVGNQINVICQVDSERYTDIQTYSMG